MQEKQNPLKRFWQFLQKDTWQSWLVSLALVFILIKFVFFPLLSLATGSPLPLVVVESCSMYHESSLDEWWGKNKAFYLDFNISEREFESFNFKSGLNKGDIILVIGKNEYKKGDIIIFEAGTRYPLIHRIIKENPISTKGDHNTAQLEIEKNIPEEKILGKAVVKIPLIGWLKLIFFEFTRPSQDRGFCK